MARPPGGAGRRRPAGAAGTGQASFGNLDDPEDILVNAIRIIRLRLPRLLDEILPSVKIRNVRKWFEENLIIGRSKNPILIKDSRGRHPKTYTPSGHAYSALGSVESAIVSFKSRSEMPFVFRIFDSVVPCALLMRLRSSLRASVSTNGTGGS